MKHECARCGKRSTIDAMVFSSWTRKRYCRDIDECAKRAKRRERRMLAA